MPIWTQLRLEWNQLSTTLSVLAASAVFALLWGLMAYVVGQWSVADGHFLRNYRPPSDYEAHIEYSMGYALRSSEANEVLFVGDSTCMCGIQPLAFEKLTGMRAYNIASVGVIGFDGYALLVRKYLEHHPKPRMVVLCVHPWALGVPPSANGPEEIRRRFFAAYDPATPQRLNMSAMLENIRTGMWHARGVVTGGSETRMNEPLPHRGGETLRTLGAIVAGGRGHWEHPGVLAPFAQWTGNAGTVAFPVLAESAKGTEDIIGLAEAHGIAVMICLTPVSVSATTEDFTELHSWLAELESKYSHVTVSRPAVLNYETSDMADLLHTNKNGSARFTGLVAETIARSLGAR